MIYLTKKYDITLEEVAYIGDDINCFELLSNVGFAACPNNAVERIKSIPNIMEDVNIAYLILVFSEIGLFLLVAVIDILNNNILPALSEVN